MVRRCQIVLASSRGKTPAKIAAEVGCSDQCVRNVIKAFNQGGLNCLERQSSRPKRVEPLIKESQLEHLQEILHQSPRIYGKARSQWTLNHLAEVCTEQGLTASKVSDETMRKSVHRLGHSWRRAKRWISSPDPAYLRKKAARDRLILLSKSHPDWVLGYLDQTWWSRLNQTLSYSWGQKGLKMENLTLAKEDTDPKALACYGLYLPDLDDLWLRFVNGRPVSAVTIDFLDWTLKCLSTLNKSALLLVWDNATWHKSKIVASWIKDHNRAVKKSGNGVRVISSLLPVKSPWLNPIEPKWLHAKRAVSEPDRVLATEEIEKRLCDYFGCDRLEPLVQPKTNSK